MLRAIFRALRLAMRRDLGTFRSLTVNNFFLFVALLVLGALEGGMPPWSAYPFFALMGLPLLFPLSSDPLEKIPAERLKLWPLETRHRTGLRLASLVLSPIFWLVLIFAIRAGGVLPLLFLMVAVVARIPLTGTSLLRYIPLLPGRLGGLVTSNLRGLFSVLDTWLAILLSVVATTYRLAAAHPDPEAFAILAMLIALALSTQTQSLFGLDYGSGTTLCHMLPLNGWQILLAKDIAWLGILLILIGPLKILPALTFGLIALATGHHSSVMLRLPQKRWRFAGGRLLPVGTLQLCLGSALGFLEMRHGYGFAVGAGIVYLISLRIYGGVFTRRFRQGNTPR